MSEMALRLIAQAKREGWKSLDLGNCGIIGQVPDEVGELADLEALVLSGDWFEWDGQAWHQMNSKNNGPKNQITHLPSYLPQNLVVLISANCEVADIATLQELNALETLNLRSTKVANIAALRGLNALRTLDLSWTQTADIAPLQGLNALRTLDLFGTELSNIAPLQGLKALQTLNLASTQVADISPLQGLHKLQTLDLSNTKVTDITHLNKLIEKGIKVKFKEDYEDGIFLEGCEVTNPPLEIAQQGNEAILRYWGTKSSNPPIINSITLDARAIDLGQSGFPSLENLD